MKVSKVEVFTVGSQWRNLTIVQVHHLSSESLESNIVLVSSNA